mmetsp:Transcript_14411/g.45423  ORF Transcript_14411/g.45423 Transcript_14411/m.45423 type:complete len:313 (-) Transcript_14411:163-1101(-)
MVPPESGAAVRAQAGFFCGRRGTRPRGGQTAAGAGRPGSVQRRLVRRIRRHRDRLERSTVRGLGSPDAARLGLIRGRPHRRIDHSRPGQRRGRLAGRRRSARLARKDVVSRHRRHRDISILSSVDQRDLASQGRTRPVSRGVGARPFRRSSRGGDVLVDDAERGLPQSLRRGFGLVLGLRRRWRLAGRALAAASPRRRRRPARGASARDARFRVRCLSEVFSIRSVPRQLELSRPPRSSFARAPRHDSVRVRASDPGRQARRRDVRQLPLESDGISLLRRRLRQDVRLGLLRRERHVRLCRPGVRGRHVPPR